MAAWLLDALAVQSRSVYCVLSPRGPAPGHAAVWLLSPGRTRGSGLLLSRGQRLLDGTDGRQECKVLRDGEDLGEEQFGGS